MGDLLETALSKATKIQGRFKGAGLTEQETKNALISPILNALGWDQSNLDMVRAEYRHTPGSNPADYALILEGRPVLLLEAKALDVQIDNVKFIEQALSYANAAGASWVMLSNGYQWDLYHVFTQTVALERRFFSAKIDTPEAPRWLSLIQRELLRGDRLECAWRDHFEERHARKALEALLSAPYAALSRLIEQGSVLSAEEACRGLSRLLVEIKPPPLPSLEALQTQVRPVEAPRSEGWVQDWTEKPKSGSKPIAWRIERREWLVSSWRAILIQSCHFFSETRPNRFKEALTGPEFQGRKYRTLSTKKERLRNAVAIPGGFAEVNFSAVDIVKITHKLFKFMDVDPALASYKLNEGG